MTPREWKAGDRCVVRGLAGVVDSVAETCACIKVSSLIWIVGELGSSFPRSASIFRGFVISATASFDSAL